MPLSQAAAGGGGRRMAVGYCRRCIVLTYRDRRRASARALPFALALCADVGAGGRTMTTLVIIKLPGGRSISYGRPSRRRRRRSATMPRLLNKRLHFAELAYKLARAVWPSACIMRTGAVGALEMCFIAIVHRQMPFNDRLLNFRSLYGAAVSVFRSDELQNGRRRSLNRCRDVRNGPALAQRRRGSAESESICFVTCLVHACVPADERASAVYEAFSVSIFMLIPITTYRLNACRLLDLPFTIAVNHLRHTGPIAAEPSETSYVNVNMTY
ncbi:hypothetical protein EVAR_56179_1 [Eumeta japonica]|uniref:Uncharacterized protein n=1 Tax=Eumeta variegata TaxID=151549 RepID=A0A4C1ZWP8_EUMVA|nr:hypothetical protein EVAR_56179_1 [Eumeta japonica]